jgi:WD40 repeat protein
MKKRLLATLIALFITTHVDADPPNKVTFDRHVLPIFESNCNDCHNADVGAGDLDLTSYNGTMAGGSSGAVIHSGDPDGSKLFRQVDHKERPYMPPEAPKMAKKHISVLRAWIVGGALRDKNSKAVKKKSGLGNRLKSLALPKLKGPPPMLPELNKEPAMKTRRANAINALSVSPGAPLLAVGAYKQVLVFELTTFRLKGILDFPEGQAHVLKFSSSGEYLLAGGGRGAHSGRVALWNVRTGERVLTLGKEYDSVLAADISADHALIALSGPSKQLKVYSTSTGQLLYTKKKHTDWITSLRFSHDGVLLASGDRNGGLYIWESDTGREFAELKGHSKGITDISWRIDNNVLASASEDVTIRLWRAEDGAAIRRWNGHGRGTLSVDYCRDGRLASCGRDYRVKIWNQNGKQLKVFRGTRDLPTRVAFSADGKTLISGDYGGQLTAFDPNSGKVLRKERTNLPTIKDRIKILTQQTLGLQKDIKAKSVAWERAKKERTAVEKDFVKVVNWQKQHKQRLRTLSNQLKQQQQEQLKWTSRGRTIKSDLEPKLVAYESLRKLTKPTPKSSIYFSVVQARHDMSMLLMRRLSWGLVGREHQLEFAQGKALMAIERQQRLSKKLRKQSLSTPTVAAAQVKGSARVKKAREKAKAAQRAHQNAQNRFESKQMDIQRWGQEAGLSQTLQISTKAIKKLTDATAAEGQARSTDSFAKTRILTLGADIKKAVHLANQAKKAVFGSERYLSETALLSSESMVIHKQSLKALKLARAFAKKNSEAAARALKAASDVKGEMAFVKAAAAAWDLAQKAQENAKLAEQMEKKARLSSAAQLKSRKVSERSVSEGRERLNTAILDEKRLHKEVAVAKIRQLETSKALSRETASRVKAEKEARTARQRVDQERRALITRR